MRATPRPARAALSLVLTLTAGLAACGEDAAGPCGGTSCAALALEALLPGAGSACFEVVFPATADAGPELHTRCGPVVHGALAFELTAPCDPSAPSARAIVRTSGVTGGGHLVDPCVGGCAVAIVCGGPPVALRLAFADDATGADWVDTQVAMPGLWLGASLTTCRDAVPIALLVDEPDGPRRSTAVVGLSAAAESEAIELTLAEPLVTCGDGTRCALPLEQERGHATAACSDGSAVDYQVFSGAESIDDAWYKRYLNVAIDLQDLIDAGHADCRLDHASTASLGPLALGPGDAWPVAVTHAPLLDADGAVACVAASFDDHREEDPSHLAIDFLRGPGLSPAAGGWSEVPPLCVSLSEGILANDCR